MQSVAPLVSFLDSLRDFTKLMNKSYKATSLLRLCIEQSSDRVKTTITTYKPQRNLNKELPKRLLKPVTTRWSSHVKAIRRFMILWEPVQQMLVMPQWREIWQANRPNKLIPFDANTYILLSSVLPPLLVFDKLILAAQGSQIMLGEMFFNVMKTHDHLKALSLPEVPGQALVRSLCDQMEKYFFSHSSRYATPQLQIDSAFQSSSADHRIDRAAHLIALSARLDPRFIISRQYLQVWSRLLSADMLGGRFPSPAAVFPQQKVDSVWKRMLLALVKHRADPSSSSLTTESISSGNVRTDLLFLSDFLCSDPELAETPSGTSAVQEVHDFWSSQVEGTWATAPDGKLARGTTGGRRHRCGPISLPLLSRFCSLLPAQRRRSVCSVWLGVSVTTCAAA